MVIKIIGGGQLAQMLSLAAHDLNLETLCLCSNDDPASLVSETTLDKANFFNEVSTVGIESEFADINIVPESIETLPSKKCLNLFKDKLEQKLFLKEHGLPTSEFLYLKGETVLDFLNSAGLKFPNGFVLKWSLYGYDGKGTHFVKNRNFETASQFIERGLKKGARIYAEDLIAFKRELALIMAQSPKSSVFFPLVETQQDNGVCALTLSTQSNFQDLAEIISKKLVDITNYIGVIAIEFFESESGLLINEIAPRVHNSGHWTQLLPKHSQFHYNILALANRDIPKLPSLPPYYGMRNLLVPKECTGEASPFFIDQKKYESLFLSWYGKKSMKPGRKMGHINFAANSKEEFDTLLEKSKDLETQIWDEVATTGKLAL